MGDLKQEWLAGFERDGPAAVEQKVAQGLYRRRREALAREWLTDQGRSALQSKKRAANWSAALKVIAAIATIIATVAAVIEVWPS